MAEEKTYTLRPIAALGATAALWLVISAVGEALSALWCAIDVFMLSNQDNFSPETMDTWQLSGLVTFPILALYVVTVVVVARWIYRASANAHALVRGLQISPPWSVGWFFIPFANFVMPYRSFSETWRVSRDPTTWQVLSTPRRMSQWWGFWIAGNILSNASGRLSMQTGNVDLLILGSAASIVASGLGIAAALILRSLILEISRAQTGHLSTQQF